jgi:outer membrane protein assembly factor BamB
MTTDRGLGRRAFLAAFGATALSGCGAAPGADETTAGETETATPTATATRTTESASEPAVSLGDTTWRMHGRDPHNTGVTATTGPEDPRRAWDVSVSGIYTLPQPSLVEGTCYVGTGNVLYAMGATDGAGRWTKQTEYLAHHYSPAVVEGTVYAPTRTVQGVRSGGGAGRLYAVDAASGEVGWTLDAALSSDPTVVGDTVYLTSSADVGRVHAVGTDGSERWTYTFDPGERRGSAYGAPVVVDDRVYVTVSAHRTAGATGYLVAIEDGEAVWRVEVGGEARAAPAYRDGTVYVATVDGQLTAVSEGGEVLWERTTADAVFSTPAVDGDQVYALVKGSVAGFDRASGERNWRTTVGAAQINGLSVAQDGVYLGGNNVTALGRDGSERWVYPIPGSGGGYGAPVVLDGAVFVGACIKWEPTDRYDDHMFALV